jgi:hypothetical protein
MCQNFRFRYSEAADQQFTTSVISGSFKLRPAAAALPRKPKLEIRLHASLSLEYREFLSAIEMEISEVRLSKFVVIAQVFYVSACLDFSLVRRNKNNTNP